ncbi:MAG: hypothetical protein ACXVGK_07865 [Mycobacteriaceae bacterium]
MQSCVTADKLSGVYDATEPALISEHATRGGFPLRLGRARTRNDLAGQCPLKGPTGRAEQDAAV